MNAEQVEPRVLCSVALADANVLYSRVRASACARRELPDQLVVAVPERWDHRRRQPVRRAQPMHPRLEVDPLGLGLLGGQQVPADRTQRLVRGVRRPRVARGCLHERGRRARGRPARTTQPGQHGRRCRWSSPGPVRCRQPGSAPSPATGPCWAGRAAATAIGPPRTGIGRGRVPRGERRPISSSTPFRSCRRSVPSAE